MSNTTPANRAAVFFGAALEEARRRDDARRAQRDRMNALDEEARQIVARLTQEHAEKDDELVACEASVAELEPGGGALVEKQKTLTQERATFENAASAFSARAWAWLSPGKAREVENDRKALEEQERVAEEALRQHDEDLDELRRRLLALQEPIRRLEEDSARVDAERADAQAQVTEEQRALRELTLRVICDLPAAELAGRLEALAPSSKDPRFFADCADAMKECVRSANDCRRRLEAVAGGLKEITAVNARHLTQLGEAIADGFRLRGQERVVDFDIHARVHFKEERGFFGWSGATGSARGDGAARGRYRVEEITWDAPHVIGERVASMTEGLLSLGNQSAQADMLRAMLASAERDLAEYSQFILYELESDLREEEA